MAPVVALEPLRNLVLAFAGAVLLLFGLVLVLRCVTAVSSGRAERREAMLTRLVYRSSLPGEGTHLRVVLPLQTTA